MFLIRSAFNNWRARRNPIDQVDWRAALAELHFLDGLSRLDQKAVARLRHYATRFLLDKDLVGAQGFALSRRMRVLIAVQAVLPVLNIGYERLYGWREVLVYPGAFRTRRQQIDEAGLVSEDSRVLSGEAAHRGGLVLSWQSIADEITGQAVDRNVIVHEIAHKIDMENGAANGMPPLPASMQPVEWSRAFRTAFDQLRQALESGEPPLLDSYAATSPAEFFAVACEEYFIDSMTLEAAFPEVHAQLVRFFGSESH